MDLPGVVFKMSPRKIYGLKSDPYRLAELRRVRQERFRGSMGEYANPEYVQKEMRYALNIFKSQPKWSVIDVTSKPIEEIAAEILALVGKSRR
jgi:regulator of PEP synthase PpsR (kinase-PPPase family)